MSQTYSPEELARLLGKKFPPTAEQAAVIEGPLGPKLVVAGAGAGKTETMASRVVWLVANGLVEPEQVLGLTFTRKAAQQLEQRIRRQLIALRDSGAVAPGSELEAALRNIAPKVATYDSYAGDLVREYGLLMPVEPSARLITAAERYAIARDVVLNYRGELPTTNGVDTVTRTLISLADTIEGGLMDTDALREHEKDLRATAEDLEKTRPNGPEFSKEVQRILDTQALRLGYLPLVDALKAEQAARGVTTFVEQMAVAATLARAHPVLGQQQSARYRVVMLDEYQDTSHAQRVLLRSLFGGQREGLSVTAVGDPMQAIYGWRGATAENLAAFVEDFPAADGSTAPKDQLTRSWRNPSTVLELANTVADGVFSASPGPRPVDALQPRAGAPAGEVTLAYFATEEEERAFVAEHLRGLYEAHLKAQARAREGEGEPSEFRAAVLVRTNRQSPLMSAALDAVGVPNEVVGVGGLLWQPEVQDLVAIATMLVRPQDSNAALRVLTGPMCGVGLADIQALHDRQRNLAGAREGRVRWEGGDPLEHLSAQLDQLTTSRPDQVLGLADALADLGERERYSPEGLARLEEVAAKLRHLRTYSLGKGLSDLFADIEAAFLLRTEVLTAGRAGGTTHLDAFADLVASYPGDSVTGFLDYLDLAREEESGLAPGEVPAASNRVQIMTVHKSKGLEWEHVCVVHADSVSYTAKAETFLTRVEKAPAEDDVIELDPEATKRSEFGKACTNFKDAAREHQAEETARLFYVAITRTESTLTVTGSGTNRAIGKSKKGPYAYLELLAQRYPQLVAHWEVPDQPVEPAAEGGSAPRESSFPTLRAGTFALRAADAVLAAIEDLPALRAGESFELWERETTALIEEHQALSSPVVEVELPPELTASDLVALSADPEHFARRQRRPVPFKPNSYAKRGTAFHAWLEDRFASPALLAEDELPGVGEVPVEDLAALKEAFLASPWAQRTPDVVEAPFEITIGSAVVRGRMDAVFREPDGSWLIVDWKTGRPPRGAAMRSAEIQLAVYAEAWRRIHGTGAVRAAFFYVHDGFLFEPARLPRGEELAALLEYSVSSDRG